MNTQPHAHQIGVSDRGHWWFIDYGDQAVEPRKPVRWWWDTPEAYAARCERRLKRHIARIVRAHDRMSQIAPAVIPEFRPDVWGSEQL